MSDTDPNALDSLVAAMLNQCDLAYVQVAESIRAAYDGVLIANSGYDKATARPM